MFASWFEGRPDDPCLVEGDRVWSRRDFSQTMAAAAHELQAQGVIAGAIVAWLGHNSVAMLATLMACERLGSVFLPLNWRLTASELAPIIEHAGAGHLLGTPEMSDLLAALRAGVALRPGRAEGVLAGDALLVYTSGTTGQPKGAMHTLAGMQANVEAAIAAQDLDRRTRTLSALPMFHVGGLCIQTLPTLAAGGVVILNPRFDPALWFDSLQAWRPTTSLMVPAVMRALILHARWDQADLSSLQSVVAGSQVVPDALIAAFHERGIPVAQIYGATETGPVSIVLRHDEALRTNLRGGLPAKGVEVRLAADGEILLRALNLMRGYHREPGPSFDAGWFHTGDLAHQHADGRIEVVGRSKELIISGGENIHPAEIENLAGACPGVAEAVALGLPDSRWGEVPVLVLVAQAGAAIDLVALQALFDARLARFKHPHRVVQMNDLPRTALGKVQRVRLAEKLLAEQSLVQHSLAEKMRAG